VNLNEMTAEERHQALEQLVARADGRAAALIGTALWESHWPVCEDLAAALARISGDTAKLALVRALKARRHHVRSAAIRALAAIGGCDARDAIRALHDDPSYEVRQDVAEVLEHLGP
jgi:hypothetical protein